jgi:hypothetical protein
MTSMSESEARCQIPIHRSGLTDLVRSLRYYRAPGLVCVSRNTRKVVPPIQLRRCPQLSKYPPVGCLEATFFTP